MFALSLCVFNKYAFAPFLICSALASVLMRTFRVYDHKDGKYIKHPFHSIDVSFAILLILIALSGHLGICFQKYSLILVFCFLCSFLFRNKYNHFACVMHCVAHSIIVVALLYMIVQNSPKIRLKHF